MLRIDTDEYDVAVALSELVKTVLEGEDFSWTDEGEGCWYEEENEPLWRLGSGVDVGFEADFCCLMRRTREMARREGGIPSMTPWTTASHVKSGALRPIRTL